MPALRAARAARWDSTLSFDKKRYETEYLRKQNAKRGLSDDLVERYAVDLNASEAEVGQQVQAVRAYWNSVRPGTRYADVVGICKSEDERFKAESGDGMLQKKWWAEKLAAKQKAAADNVGKLAEQLKAAHSQLGVISQATVDAVADANGVTSQQVANAAREAGLEVVAPRTLPESPLKGKLFDTLEIKLQVCGAKTIPGLLHPEAGEFRILDGFRSVADGSLRLDLPIVKERSDAAQKTAPGVTNDAKREALGILKSAGEENIDLAHLALAHLVDLAKGVASQGPSAVLDEMLSLKVERSDAAVIAALLAEERGSSGAASKAQVDRLLAEGNLAQASQLAQAIPEDNDQRAAAIAAVSDARARLDALTGEIRSSVDSGNEVRAASLVTEVRQISFDDAEDLLASVPLPPVTGLRVVGDDDQVKLVWQPNTGHGEGTTYVVKRSESGPPLSPADGHEVASTEQVTAVDAHSPVAHPTHYSVFATAPRRPSSRAVSDSVIVLPPVANVGAEVGSSDMTVHWSAHPACAGVEVHRTGAGQSPERLEADHNSVRLTGLTEGVPVHIEIVALYRTQTGEVLRSSVAHVDETPRSAAKPLERLKARPVVANGGDPRVRVSWNPVDHSDVRILHSSGPPPWGPGTWIGQDDVTRYGSELTGNRSHGGSELSIEADLEPGIHHLVAVSIGGTGIVVGASTVVGVTDPVRNPLATIFGNYATLSWEWPASAQIAEVHWQRDDDQDIFEITRADYMSKGGARVPLGHSACKVEIRAMIHTEAGSFASPAVKLSVGAEVDAEISYHVASSGIGGFGGRSKKVTFLSDRGCSGVQVRVVASPGKVMPTSADDKFVLIDERLNLAPGKPAEYKASVPKAITKPYWVRCFVIGGGAHLVHPPITELKE